VPTDNAEEARLGRVLQGLLRLGRECERIEFKHSYANPDGIGEYVSALSNSAAIEDQEQGFLVWGVEDGTLDIVGTSFDPYQKHNNQDFENWLSTMCRPRLGLRFYPFNFEEKNVVILEIDRAYREPSQFKSEAYVRVGSAKKKLKEHPEKSRELHRRFEITAYEDLAARVDTSAEEVLELLDFETYHSLNSRPIPESAGAKLEPMTSDDLLKEELSGRFAITNLGALLYGRQLGKFKGLVAKEARLIQYKGTDRTIAVKEWRYPSGYACSFEAMLQQTMDSLPTREIYVGARRAQVPMCPELAVRELIANALIHQDFAMRGFSVTIEVFSNRVEIMNPGEPILETDRFLDLRRSRNEAFALHMRRLNFCEERGSGIDKVFRNVEASQLPAPEFRVHSGQTQVVLFGPKNLEDLDRDARIRACFWHASLHYVSGSAMTNTSLRERFGIPEHNSAKASRLIGDAVAKGVIKPKDASASNKNKSYIPYWAV
jgi:ATP-dependent DNA helicase RecG